MKQKLLTLLVLLVSTLCAFAQSDATGSGVGSDTQNGDKLGSKGVAYTYTFTESLGTVTMTVEADGTGCVGIDANATNSTNAYDYTTGAEKDLGSGGTYTWDGLAVGTVIRVKLWWAIAFGRSTTDEITYTVKGSTEKDEEAPVWAKAEATNIKDSKATLVLNATDNAKGTLTFTVKNGEKTVTATGKQGTDVKVDIDGLTAETAYTVTVIAVDASGNASEEKTISFTTAKAFTLTAPAAPTVEADKVLSIMSATYTPAVEFTLPNWSQQTATEKIEVDGVPMLHMTKYNYQGLEFPDLDLSAMNMVHVDILARAISGNVRLYPIFHGKEQAQNIMLSSDPVDQWKSVDLPLSAYNEMDFSKNKVFQLKFDREGGTDGTDELYIANIYFYNNGVEQTFKSFTLSNTLTGAKSTLATEATPVASDGTAFKGDVAYTISEGAHLTADGNKLTITADAAGLYTITATSGEQSATATVRFVESAAEPTTAADNVLAYYSDKYNQGLTGVTVYNKAWEKGWSTSDEVSLTDNDHAILVTGVGTWGLTLGAKDVTAYNKLCADVYAIEEAPIKINYESTSVPEYNGTLQIGWNHIEIDLADYARTGANYVKFNIGNDSKHDYTCLFDNIYVAAGAIDFNVTTANGTAKVVGDVTAENVADINNADAMAIDLSSILSISEDAKIEPKHKNAIIIIPGKWDDVNKTNTIADKYEPLKNVKNVVVLDGYYRPYKTLEFVDEPGEPLWKGEGATANAWIATQETGWKLTRTIKAHSYASVCVYPNAINEIPEGLSAWEAVNYDETNGISFNKSNAIAANFPYIVYNSTDEDIDLVETTKGDLNFKNYFAAEPLKKKLGDTDVYFCGNFAEELVTDGTQWIVKNGTGSAVIKPANGAKISPFRAYFTGLDATASEAKLNFIGGEATGINGVNAAEAADGAIYNLAGQKVNAAYKGIVIKNGKKFLVK